MWVLVSIFFACLRIEYYIVTDALRYDAVCERSETPFCVNSRDIVGREGADRV